MKINHHGKSLVSWLLTMVLFVTALHSALPIVKANADVGTTYYIDSANGNDANTGTSETSAWKTLSKVSGKTTFQPGDKILLKCGSVFNHSWSGQKSEGPFILASSGTVDNPIVIASYGEGPRPVINANGAYCAIAIINQQYVTVQDLELTNFKASNPQDYLTEYHRRSGIWIRSFDHGVMRGITIRNMDIHHVAGMNVTGETTVTAVEGDPGVNKNHNAAILLNAWELDKNPATVGNYDGVLIENNNIHDVATIGISVDGYMTVPDDYHKNIVIRGNVINKTGADGIIIGVSRNPLVEYNVSYDAGSVGNPTKWIAGMWFWRTDTAVMQNNEVARVAPAVNQNDTDSMAFDTDVIASGDHIFQYNYSHDNAGGFYMDMGRLVNGRNIVRYNISQNDKHGSNSNSTIATTDPGLFHNNVFYNDKGDGFVIKENPRVTFVNNIFYVTNNNSVQYPSQPLFYYNAFYGQAAPLQAIASIVGDPMFVDPGKGGDGISTVTGYQLKQGSPLIGAGTVISDNGGKDFWGNSLYSARPDMGAYEMPGSTVGDMTTVPTAPMNARAAEILDTTVKFTWTSQENGIPLDAEIYDAATDAKVGAALVSNECTVEGLTPDTAYTFYIRARNASGLYSEKSDNIELTTCKSVLMDENDAVKVGEWTTSTTDMTSFAGDYYYTSAGTGAKTVTYTPNLTETGYYAIYYWIPRGTSSRTRTANFKVVSENGETTYLVDESVRGGFWRPLGVHQFNAGSEGYLQISDKATAQVSADAIKFIYLGSSGLAIESVNIGLRNVQIPVAGSTSVSVMGIDANGKQLDLVLDGADLDYISDDPSIATVDANGSITGVADGTTYISVICHDNGKDVVSNKVEIVVGSVFRIGSPVFTDNNGNVLTSLTEGTVNTTVTIINSNNTKIMVTLVAVLYSPDGLVKYGTAQTAINQNKNIDLRVALTMPQDVTGHCIKVFIWDGIDSLRPLTDVTTFE